MKIFWTEKAIGRIGEIVQYISRDSLQAAEKWAEKIVSRVESLDRKEYRELIIGNYRVIYKISGETLFVLTVRHFKQILPIEEIK